MTDENVFESRYNYALVRVDDKDDLHWVKAIIYQMQADRVISKTEHGRLFVSLIKDKWNWRTQ